MGAKLKIAAQWDVQDCLVHTRLEHSEALEVLLGGTTAMYAIWRNGYLSRFEFRPLVIFTISPPRRPGLCSIKLVKRTIRKELPFET